MAVVAGTYTLDLMVRAGKDWLRIGRLRLPVHMDYSTAPTNDGGRELTSTLTRTELARALREEAQRLEDEDDLTRSVADISLTVSG